MKHTLECLTDRDILAALENPNVPKSHKIKIFQEIIRRANEADETNYLKKIEEL